MDSSAQKTFGRKLGYSVSVVVNSVLLYLVNVSPGWEVVPFLTGEAAQVVFLVNLSLVVGIVLNLVYAVYDPAPLKAFGEVVTTGIALTVVFRLLNVFPFDFPEDWTTGIRVSMVFVAICVLIALIVQVVKLIRALTA